MTLKTFRDATNLAALLVGVAILAASPVASASATDPAVARIDSFDQVLLGVLKAGPSLGAKGRYQKLAPTIQASFDLPLMTQFAVGPSWASMSDADHQALIAAFGRLSTASYARNFDKFNGEKFTVDPEVTTRGPDKIVTSQLISGGKTIRLTYRMRQSGGVWKIVDVYFDAISQLTTRRSDFAAPLAAGGAKGLIAHLNATADKLLQSS
jgi:phospholipid transport system substrate-binding protein